MQIESGRMARETASKRLYRGAALTGAVRRVALTLALLGSALLLAGCTSADSTSATFNNADEMFVIGMIPHHEQAIEMSDVILAKGDIDEDVSTLAKEIKIAQSPEIELMKGLLEDWGVPYDGSMSGMHHGNMGDGMMSDDDMAALVAATGTDASRLFLEGMILHHEGAVAMAQMVLESGKNPEVARLAEQIIASQTTEIAAMQGILTTLK
jgi:uncharacterized protein (DUF305 family)